MEQRRVLRQEQRTVGGAQLAQDCLDLDPPVADAAADHLHAGAI